MNGGNALLRTLLLSFSLLGYGPVQDHSEFVSASLTENNRTVLFTFHRFMYKPAEGWRAFPDGGIPRYVEDVNIIAAYDLEAGSLKILHREKNTQWQPGSGLFSLQGIKATKALLIQGGQLRSGLQFHRRFVLLDLGSGQCDELELESDLAKYHCSPGQIYLVDGTGSLLFITSVAERTGTSGAGQNPELWVRNSRGNYVKVTNSGLYECTREGEVIYWEPSSRTFKGFSIVTGQTRELPNYRTAANEDVTHGVIVSSDRRGLQVGEKVAGQWNYRPLEIKPGTLK